MVLVNFIWIDFVSLLQILCFCTHLYGVKVYHGTTQEESGEEDQSEEDVRDVRDKGGSEEDNSPEYQEDIDYTKFFHKDSKKGKSEQKLEPFDLSKFFQDVDAGKYNRKGKKNRREPSQSETVNSKLLAKANLKFPDFFDAAATNTFQEIVEQETDHHVGPAMSQDFDRLVEDIDFDINMQDHRSRHVRSAEGDPRNTTKNSNLTSLKVNKNEREIDRKKYTRKRFSEANKNGTLYQPTAKSDTEKSQNTEVSQAGDIIIENDTKGDKTIGLSDLSVDKSKKDNGNNLNKEYFSVIEKLKKEMNDKITRSNVDLMKTLSESNAYIKDKIQKVKDENNITDTPSNYDYADAFGSIFNSTNNMTMFGGDSKISPKFATLKSNKSEELDGTLIKEFSGRDKEILRKRYASDAYFPEVEDYPSYDSSSEGAPNYDDYETSSQSSDEPSKPNNYNYSPSESHETSPYNPQNIPPSSSFAHMYRTFDNDDPVSTHYSTNHDPNHSSHETKGTYPENYEPYSKYIPPSHEYGTNYNEKSRDSKPSSMIDVEGDSPDLDYQKVKEPRSDKIELDENGFDIDKFISDFNTDPPYKVEEEEEEEEEPGDEGGDEEGEEGEGDGESETNEGETETRPQEYTYKRTIYGGKPQESNFERASKKTRSSDFRPKKYIKTPSRESSFGTSNFKNTFRQREQDFTGHVREIPEKMKHSVSQKKSKPTKKCIKSTKTVPGGKRKMTCKLCENLKTGGKSEHCSYLINPNKDNYVVGTEEVTYRSINQARRKRDLNGQLKELEEKSQRSKREFDYDLDDEEDEDDKEDNIEAEYGPQYDPYFGEPVGYKSSDGGSCRTVYDDDGAECRVCRNRKTNGEFKECSYASKPQKSAYEFGSSKVYGSGKSPRFRRNNRFRRSDLKEHSKPETEKYLKPKTKHYKTNKFDQSTLSNSAEFSRLKTELLEGVLKSENRANEEVSKEDDNLPYLQKSSLRPSLTSSSNEGGEYNNNQYNQGGNNDIDIQDNDSRGSMKRVEDFRDADQGESKVFGRERKSTDIYNDHFSQSFPELLNGRERESMELPSFKKRTSLLGGVSSKSLFSNGNGFSDDKFSSRNLLNDDGFKTKGLLDDKGFFKNNHLKLGSRFSDTKADARELFNDRDSDNLNRMFGEFAAKDRSNCKKRYKDKMTCYACVDENNIRQEECIYIKNSEPETKQVAYQETNQYNNPKAQSSEGHETKIYSSPTHELYEDEYETPSVPEHRKKINNFLKMRSNSDERTSGELNRDIKKKSPKQLGPIKIGNRDEEMEAIQNMDIQKVSKGKRKPNGKRKEQSYSGSSHIESIQIPSASLETEDDSVDASVSRRKKNISDDSTNSQVYFNESNIETPPDAQVESSQINENIEDLNEEPEEPDREGPEGAFSDETRLVYDPDRKVELPKYMVEKSEGERIFDQFSRM